MHKMIGLREMMALLCVALSVCLLLSSAGRAEETLTPSADGPGDVPKARKVITIATIGSAPLSVAAETAPQKIVDMMIAHWQRKFARVLPDKPDLIVVPEVCDRPAGLSLDRQRQYYQVRKNQVQDFFAKVARENHCYIIYAAHRCLPDGTWRNSSVLIDRNGEVAGVYNKNHPTIDEIDNGILCGHDAPVIECDFGRVALAICFDLNFDELRLKHARARPDLILFSSMYHGGLMQAYWAYSCRCHFVGAIAGQGTSSEIRDPLGRVLAATTNYFDYAVATVNLDCAVAHLDYNWERLRRLKAKYGPMVDISDPGCLGSVLITSRHPEKTVTDMIREFEIELLDDYLDRALAYRHRPGHME